MQNTNEGFACKIHIKRRGGLIFSGSGAGPPDLVLVMASAGPPGRQRRSARNANGKMEQRFKGFFPSSYRNGEVGKSQNAL